MCKPGASSWSVRSPRRPATCERSSSWNTRQEAARIELQARVQEARELQLNTEFTQGTLDGTVDVSVGDNLFDKISRTEILVKDGIVLEIRETASPRETAASPLITPAGG